MNIIYTLWVHKYGRSHAIMPNVVTYTLRILVVRHTFVPIGVTYTCHMLVLRRAIVPNLVTYMLRMLLQRRGSARVGIRTVGAPRGLGPFAPRSGLPGD